MLIVHLSDLHCGAGTFSDKALQTAVEEINKLGPEVVIITGDITDAGLVEQFKLAAKRIRGLRCDKVFVGSGNHDFEHTGFLVWEHFFPRPEKVVFDDFMISHLRTARPDRDVGEVGHRQLLWFEELLHEHRDRFKIVALHHHLVPIPDTGTSQNLVVDAGDALKTLISGEVDLVLCGHKHRPWRLVVDGMPIVHAGSVSSKRLRGFFANSYNILEVKRKSVKLELKVVGGERVSFKKILRGYDALE